MDEREKTKMINGQLFNPKDPLLVHDHNRCVKLTTQFNNLDLFKILGKQQDKHFSSHDLLKSLLGTCDSSTHIEPPCHFGYGYNIHVGSNFHANHGLVIDDECPVTFGNNCHLGPNVHIYSATHSTDPTLRLSGLDFGKPVDIGHNVSIGGNSVLLPGISIGSNAVILPGSVVTKHVPPNTLVGGNPARVLRTL
jgi:maltose O-acetyltransferase